MVFVTPDQKNIYTTNVNAGTVSNLTDTLIAPGGPPMGAPPQGPPGGTPQGQPPMGPPQPRRDWMHTVIPVAKGSEGFDVSPDGKQLWTVSGMDGSISIVDLKSKMMASKIDANILGANRLKFTPDGKRVLVSSLRTGDLFVYDVATHKEIKRVPIGHGGAGILVDADGSRAFIGCTPDNYVAVVDLKKLELVNKIELGGPDGLAWAVQQ
jgi:YVTN family beta-propeller protein